MKGNLVTDH